MKKQYDYDLVFDEGEIGGYTDIYFALVTDYGMPANILVRFPGRERGEEPDVPQSKAKHLALELVKRWNTRSDPAIKELVDALETAVPFIGYAAHVPDILERARALIAKYSQKETS